MNPGEKQKGSRAYAKPHLLKQIASKNAYERQRNENVASNIKYMVDCGLSQAAKTFNRSLGIGGNDQRYSGNKRDSRDENYEPPEGDTRESSGYETGDYIASTHKHTKKDLDLTKPGIQRSPKRAGFETNTEEVLKKADFRALFSTSRKTHTDGALCPSRIRTHDKSGPGQPGQREDLHKDSTLTSTSERLPSSWSLRVQKNISSGPVPEVSTEVAPVPSLHSIDIANGGNLVASSFTRQVRGKNRGKGTEYLVSKYGKLSVEIPEAFNVPVGLNANPLINELSKDIKALAPIQGIKYWRDIDPSIRESIIQRSRDKFNIKDYDVNERVRNAINKKCSRGYCNWKSMLYRHYMALLKAGSIRKS